MSEPGIRQILFGIEVTLFALVLGVVTSTAAVVLVFGVIGLLLALSGAMRSSEAAGSGGGH